MRDESSKSFMVRDCEMMLWDLCTRIPAGKRAVFTEKLDLMVCLTRLVVSWRFRHRDALWLYAVSAVCMHFGANPDGSCSKKHISQFERNKNVSSFPLSLRVSLCCRF